MCFVMFGNTYFQNRSRKVSRRPDAAGRGAFSPTGAAFKLRFPTPSPFAYPLEAS